MPLVTYASQSASTIQGAWDSLRGKPLPTAVTIEVAAGTYAEGLVLNDQPYSSQITIQGDTRAAAGQHFETTGSIVKSGSNCTITLVNTPPSDFTTADFIIVGGAVTAANSGRFPIVSINTGLKTVTYANASGVNEAVRQGTRVIFCPDRILDFTGFVSGVECRSPNAPTFSGFTVLSSSTSLSHGVLVYGPGGLVVKRCAVYGIHDNGLLAIDGGVITTDANCSAVRCARGLFTTRSGNIAANGTYAADHTAAAYTASTGAVVVAANAIATNSIVGFLAQYGGTMHATATATFNTNAGFIAENNGSVYADGSTARNNKDGYQANWQGMIGADNTSANASGNTANYATTNGGIIRSS